MTCTDLDKRGSNGMQHRSRANYLAGLAAEDMVARNYVQRGCAEAARRWRGQGGEIDLIMRDGDSVVFIEVKKSRTHGRAVERVTRRQMDRICMAASEFVGREPRGSLTPMRFDVATVDQSGQVQVIANAFGGW
ncbi:YraN family protein [Loktanella salsilacus]|uniref:YraN family protein n=1 Tax=Loktanella salsilacus TaxID=195913 RepID=UPI0037353EF2